MVMAKAMAHVGDVLRLTTKRGRTALVRIVGVHPPGSVGTIRFDRFTRQTLKAFPHEELTIEKVDPPAAQQVTLIPAIDISMLRVPNLVPQIKEILSREATPVHEGMMLYVRPPQALAGINYDVHAVTAPPLNGEGVSHEGIVTPETELYLEMEHDHDHDHGPGTHTHDEGGVKSAETVVDTTFEDVGGLSEQIRGIREFVELPLVFPQLYRQLGISPPRGVIFYGAPGTGKTLLARSVANEINAQFFYINGPEVVGTFSGQTEENLRRIFGEASFKPPSIIFIDELDAIAPARRTASTLSDARAVTQLLSLMDGLKRAEGVMVIGTTNRIEAIDPALRRAGRFDREVYFPTPSVHAREEILRVQTREMPMTEEAIDALPEVAQQAYGFVGADIMELAREAGLNALRRATSGFIANQALAAVSPEDLMVTSDDFQSALKSVHPASLRESVMSYPTTTWSDIGGLAHVKERLRELIEKPLHHPELFERLGLSTNLGVLLYGPPGTGKTLLARAVARESGVNFISIQGPELFSQWFGESEESVRNLFNLARRASPCIVFFDQLDAIAPNRAEMDQEGTRAPQRIVNQLLSELDGMEQLSPVIVIGATNRVGMVDPAVLRPGRFGVHLYVGLPDATDRAEIFRVHLRDAALAPNTDQERLISYLAAHTEGFSGADISYLCQAAKLRALDTTRPDAVPELSLAHFEAVLPEFGKTPELSGADSA
jgi:transitional endoplasmic reticulum ATPase